MGVRNILAGETALWEQFRTNKDSQTREQLILAYLPLVKYLGGRIAITLPPAIQKDDLVSYGILGLMDAIDKFDPNRGFKFETYAYTRIKGAIIDGLRTMDWAPTSLRQKARVLEKAYFELENRLGRSATDQETAEAMGISLDNFHQLLLETGFLSLQSLDEQNNSQDGSFPLGQQLIDDSIPDPVEQVELEERKALLASSISKLPDKERLVLSLYYEEELTLKEIGEVMGLSESRISQLHTKAILRLRGSLSRMKKKLGW